MREEGVGSGEVTESSRGVADPAGVLLAEGGAHRAQIFGSRGFVAGNTDRVRVDESQVHTAQRRGVNDTGGRGRYAREDGVEVQLVNDLDTLVAQAALQRLRATVHLFGDRLQSVRAVVDGVHRCHHREE